MENEAPFVHEICGMLSEVCLDTGKVEIKADCQVSTSIEPEGCGTKEIWWEKLKLLQCPFSWNDVDELERDDEVNCISKRILKMEEKLKEDEGHEEFHYRRLILYVVLVFEHFRNSNTKSSLATLRETEALLTLCSSVGSLSKLVMDVRDALNHIVSACRMYLQFHSGDFSELEHLFAKITMFDDMTNVCKAAVSGFRAAALMEYGYKGKCLALKHIEVALSLDPDQGEWHFLFGMCSRGLRRSDAHFQIPSREELKSFEEAVKKNRNALYVVFLAQAYREAAFRVYSEERFGTTSSSAAEIINKMNKQSVAFYKETLELGSDSSHINVRCAQGFMNLPYPFKDLALAEKCLDEALKQAPNNAMIHHTVAKFYERHKKNITEATKHYEQAVELGAFGAYMDLLHLRYTENSFGYDPIPDLEIALTKYQDTNFQIEVTLQMGAYYLFIMDDVENAFKYWEKVIDQDPDIEKLKKLKCMFIPMLKTVNAYEVLCDEARLILNSKPDKAQGKESVYQQIIMKCMKHYPACISSAPVPRREEVLAEVCKQRAQFQSKLQRRGKGRGKGLGGESDGCRSRNVGEQGIDNVGREGGICYGTGNQGNRFRGQRRGRGYCN